MNIPTVTETVGGVGRCPIRDEGHRCRLSIGHSGLHTAFGQSWSGVLIVKKEKA